MNLNDKIYIYQKAFDLLETIYYCQIDNPEIADDIISAIMYNDGLLLLDKIRKLKEELEKEEGVYHEDM